MTGITGNEHHIIRTPTGEKVHLTRVVINQPLKRENRPILKVVGASWFQTRVSSYIIAAMSLLGIVTIIMGELGSRYVEDRNYAATVFWRQKSNFRIEFWGQGNVLEEIPRGAARAYFRLDIDRVGWSILEIETSSKYPDSIQAYAAGLLEGSLTWQSIYYQWKNTIETWCSDREDECNKIREFLKENGEVIRTLAQQNEDSPYWHQIRLFYFQIDGLQSGWNYAVKRSRQDYEIPEVDFLWLNIISDLTDLKRKFGIAQEYNILNKNPGLSTAFIKMHNSTDVPNLKELYMAHNTAADYNTMLRVLKRYEFNYHENSKSKSSVIPGTRIQFTGYPGAISSHDDFYEIRCNRKVGPHHLAVTGTPLTVFNDKLWSKVESDDLLLSGPRVMAANRLAKSGKEWAEIVGRGDIGTGNKQWMIVDLNKFQSGGNHLGNGLVWIVEQIPGKSNASDVSVKFIEQGYWATYGVPYFDYINQHSGNKEMEIKNGPEFSYLDSTKSQYFKLNHQICNSFHDTLTFMRNVTKQQSISDVALRGDLLIDNIRYGVIDTKALTINNRNNFNIQFISGPPHTQIDELALLPPTSLNGTFEKQDLSTVLPFDWTKSNFEETPHNGHPNIWKFNAIRPEWVWE